MAIADQAEGGDFQPQRKEEEKNGHWGDELSIVGELKCGRSSYIQKYEDGTVIGRTIVGY